MRELLEQTRLYLWELHNELLCDDDRRHYEKFSIPKSMNNFKFCPFCGSTNIKVYIKGTGELKYAAVCENCDARSGRQKTKNFAIEKWNERWKNENRR